MPRSSDVEKRCYIMKKTIVHGDLVYAKSPKEVSTVKDGYMVIEDSVITYVGKDPVKAASEDTFLDYKGKLIIPGFADLHLHAPQFPNIGLGADMELLPWLEQYTFPEEAKYADVDYAEEVYKRLINQLWSVGTLNSAIFASLHEEATTKLYDLLIESGLGARVGKVNMDRNSPDFYVETTEESIRQTNLFIEKNLSKSDRVKPIVTPRFVPSCTEELMKELGKIAAKHDLPIQSHLDENKDEIEWVCSLHPDSACYSEVYDTFKLFGQQPTLMAHCIYCNDDEVKMMSESNVYAVHCPFSNANLISGIMPIKKYMEKGVKVALGSDISGGHEINIAKVMVLSMQLSKMLAVHEQKPDEFLTTPESFFLATKSGGSFFGKRGSFEEGYKGDFLVIDDSDYLINERDLMERLEKFLYVSKPSNIIHRYMEGEELAKPFPELP